MRRATVRSNLLVPEVREVMDIRQASDYLGISPDTLYKYASEGFVPAFKLGNRWRFKRSRLDEWMDRQSDMQAAETEVDPRQKRSPYGRRCKGWDHRTGSAAPSSPDSAIEECGRMFRWTGLSALGGAGQRNRIVFSEASGFEHSLSFF